MTRRQWAALAAGTVALLGLHVLLVRPVHGFLLSDTTGYLANARWFAGKAGETWQGETSFYHPLWSLLVAPLYLVLDAPRSVQVGALALNALLATAVLPAGFVLARRVFGLPFLPALLAAAVAATYPAVLLLAGYEWAEPLYQLLFVVWAVAAAAAVERTSMRSAVAVAAAAGALNATHPRGLGVVAVTAVLLVVLGRRHRPALVGLGVLVALFLLVRIVNAALLDAIYSEVSAGVEGDVLSRITDPALVWGAIQALVGQLWYLTVATLGLVPLGALWLATTRRISRPVGWVLLGGLLATLATSALQMADGTRVDHMVYGRYVEGAVPVLLVAGAAGLVAWRSVLHRLLFVVAGFGGLLALVLVGIRGGDRFGPGDVMPLNVTGILAVRDAATVVDVARVSLLALLAAAVVVAVARWRGAVALGLVGVLFAASASSVQARTLRPFDRMWSAFADIPEVVRDLPVDEVSIHRGRGYDQYAANLYQLELSDLDVTFSDGRPETDLVIGPERWPEAEAWGARLVAVEYGPVYEQGLWVLPGRLLDRLDTAGQLLPADLATPLPESARRQRVEASPPSSLAAGGSEELEVVVANRGTGPAWVPAHALDGRVAGAVRLGARWYDEDGVEVLSQAVDLPRVVGSDDRVKVTLPVVAPETSGRYRLTIGLRQEEFEWFPGPAEFSVDVR